MAHQTSFGEQVTRDPDSTRVGSARTRLTTPIGACVMRAEKLGAFSVIELYYGHERMAFIQDIISQLNPEGFLDIDNRDSVAVFGAYAHPSQAYDVITCSISLIWPFP